ncbi:MAG: tail fiber domain-containing protein [Bacteroidota bacterium]
MGSKVSVPGPTPEERELQKNQAELLAIQRQIIEQQQAQNKILLPFLAEQEGFDVQVNDQGVITKIAKRADPDEAKRKELESGLLDRSLKALKGELPVDPGLEQNLQQQEKDLRDRLAAQFGPGYETTTPGIETLGEFFRTSEILREGARTGQLTLAEQLGITREQQDQFQRQSSQDVLRQTAIGDPLTFAGAFGQTARGYGQAQVPFIEQRRMQLDASRANAANSTALLGAGIGLFGAFLSDRRVKMDVMPIGTDVVPGVPLYEFSYIWDPDTRYIGPMADDLQKVAPDAVFENEDGYLFIDGAKLNRLLNLRHDEAVHRLMHC